MQELEVNTSNGNLTSDLTERQAPWGARYHWEIGDDVDNCTDVAANCFDILDIEEGLLADLDDHISNGASGVQTFFSDEALWSRIFPSLGIAQNIDFLSKLKSGNYEMNKVPGLGTKVFYVANGGNPYEEFAFQVNVR